MTQASSKLGWLFAILLIPAGSCASPRPPAVELDDTGRPALHAVHGKRLRRVMKRMESLLQERQRTQPELDEERRAYAEDAAEIADDLLVSARYISEAESDLDLSSEERAVFLALQEKLVRQVRTLQALARQRTTRDLPSAFDQLTTTCNACHSNFRDLSRRERAAP
jgi:cytochrome c556